MDKHITADSPAKVNLTLDIIGKRHDGYHTLKSIMQTVALFDTLEFSAGSTGTKENKIQIHCAENRYEIPCDKKNLIHKAARAFFAATQTTGCSLEVKLQKRIPAMAGLGGGSTNAAATLCALNELFETNLNEDALCDIGVTLGADVPFCIKGGTVLCEGIGDILTPLPALPDCYFLLVKPAVNISTPEAYAKYDRLKKPPASNFDDIFTALALHNLQTAAENLFNALEYAAQNPEIIALKKAIHENGALGTLMSGSGSAVYGIFENKKAAKKALEQLEDTPFANSLVFAEICKPHRGGQVLK